MSAEIDEMRKRQLGLACDAYERAIPKKAVFVVVAGLQGVQGFGAKTNASSRDLKKIGAFLLEIAATAEKEEAARAKQRPRLVP